MADRDQSEHPLRFAVTASTVSGLLVLVISAAIGRVARSGIFAQAALPWTLAAITCISLAAGGLASAWRKPARRDRRRVFLMVPAFSQKHWVAELIRDLHDDLERRGYDLVLKIPDRDYSGAGQIRLLDSISRHKSDYAGGFIVVNEVEQTRESIVRFCLNVSMPVIFVDVKPFEDAGDYPPRTAFVGYDAGKIGGLAADWLIGHLRRQRVKRARVLVMSGDAHPERQREFCRLLLSVMRDAQIIEESADFDRLRAREVARKQLRRLAGSGKPLHAIFCTNDEMALGVVDALIFADSAIARDAVVIGVDGTPQARALIDAGPGPLRATVVQDADKVAEIAVELLEKMMRNDKVPTCTGLVGNVLARD